MQSHWRSSILFDCDCVHCCEWDFNGAQLKAAIIKRTQRVIVPLDHGKIGVVDLARVCGPREIDIVVTDYANDHLSGFAETILDKEGNSIWPVHPARFGSALAVLTASAAAGF